VGGLAGLWVKAPEVLQDAAPITLGQVVSAWVAQLDRAIEDIRRVLPNLYELAIGGTAVGTGLNAPPHFGGDGGTPDQSGNPQVVCDRGKQVRGSFSAHDAMVTASGALRTLAGALMKIANDLRWYACGPRAAQPAALAGNKRNASQRQLARSTSEIVSASRSAKRTRLEGRLLPKGMSQREIKWTA